MQVLNSDSTTRAVTSRRMDRNDLPLTATDRLTEIANRQQNDLNSDYDAFLNGFNTTYDTLLDQIKEKNSTVRKAALPLIERALDSHQETFEVVALSTFNVYTKMLKTEGEIESRRITQTRQHHAAIHEKQCAVARNVISLEAKQHQLAFFGVEAAPADLSHDRALFDWLRGQESAVKQQFPSPSFHFKNQIRETLAKFREQYESSQEWYRKELLGISEDILNARARDPAAEEMLDFIIYARTDLAMLYLSTAQNLLQLDLLNLDIQLRKYNSTIEVMFAIRIKHLELLEEKIALLNNASTNELKLVIAYHEMKLEEENQRISQLIQWNQLQQNRNRQRFAHVQQMGFFDRKKFNNVLQAQLEEERYARKLQLLEESYNQEMNNICAFMRVSS